MKTKFWLIGLGLCAVVLGGLGIYSGYHVTSPVVSTSDWKTYTNNQFGVKMSYPPADSYATDYGWGSFDIHFTDPQTKLAEAHFVIEEKDGYCFEDMCDWPVSKEVTYNGVTWKSLGSTYYGDVNAHVTYKDVYTTIRGKYRYIFVFQNPEISSAVLKNFQFLK